MKQNPGPNWPPWTGTMTARNRWLFRPTANGSLWGLRMAVDDNNDVLPFSQLDNAWISGGLDFNPNNPSNWDPEVDIKQSLLSHGCQSVGIFKCPADRSVIKPAFGPFKGHSVSRVRSMSMSVWVGGNGPAGNFVWEPGWRVYRRFSDMVDPGPSNTYVFLDVREDAINSGGCGVVMEDTQIIQRNNIGEPIGRPVTIIAQVAFPSPTGIPKCTGGIRERRRRSLRAP